MEARFILNNSHTALNEDLNFINDLLLKPKPENIHLLNLEYDFQYLTSRVNQFVLEYSVNKDLSVINNTKEALQKLDVTLKTGIKNLETGNKEVIQTTFTFMNSNSWAHIDFSKVISKGLDAINSIQSTFENDPVLQNKDEDLACQPIIVRENTFKNIPNVILDVISVVSCEISQNIPNLKLEQLKILCGKETQMFRHDSIVLVEMLKAENNFTTALDILLDKLGGVFGIDRYMINNLLSKKTTLENDWECKIYLFDVLIKRGEPDAYTFSSFIKSANEHNNYGQAKIAFEIAKHNPRYLNSYTYFAIIKVVINNKEFEDAKILIKEAVNKGMLNAYTIKAITGKLVAAHKK